MIKQLATIPRIFRGIITTFMVIIGLRVVSPINDAILNMFSAGQMRVTAILAMWLIYIFIMWALVWAVMFAPEEQAEGGMV